MSYGKIEYDQEGNPICEICKKSFIRVLTHVRQKHNIFERDYKLKFGFDLSKGICSKESSLLSRTRALENYEKAINRNLVQKGSKTRFKKGDKGRTKDQVSAQTKAALALRAKNMKSQEEMKEAGKKLGKSGLGNKKRWSKTIIEVKK